MEALYIYIYMDLGAPLGTCLGVMGVTGRLAEDGGYLGEFGGGGGGYHFRKEKENKPHTPGSPPKRG